MADVELLPLPWRLCHFHDETQLAIKEYARANVEHHTAVLRAEVERWRGQHMRDSAKLRRVCQCRDEHKARAERLAEALRSSADALERLAFAIRAPNAHTPQLVELAIAMRAAALAQEGRNG